MKKKRKWLKWVIILGVLAALVLIFIVPAMRNVSSAMYQKAEVQRGTISTYYSFSGNVNLAKQETHTSLAESEVREIYVREGDSVKKDDRLIRLSDGRTLKAGIPGEITNVAVDKDDTVTAGQTLIEIADFGSMRIEFDVDEFDVSAVSVGSDAQVTIDALDYTFTSPVTRISKTSQTAGDITYYTARIEPPISELPTAVLPGMRVDVKTLGAYAENVLMVKMDALGFDEYNKPYVLMPDGENMKRVYVETGINDGVSVEIKSGLSEGDTIYYMAKLSDIEALMQARAGMTGIK